MSKTNYNDEFLEMAQHIIKHTTYSQQSNRIDAYEGSYRNAKIQIFELLVNKLLKKESDITKDEYENVKYYCDKFHEFTGAYLEGLSNHRTPHSNLQTQ